MKNILKEVDFKCRVSTVLNRNAKEYGKTFLFDDHEDTCWNSDQGTPQWIDLEFPDSQLIHGFKLQFQGGFVGQDCNILASSEGSMLQVVQAFYPEDVNAPQTFSLSKPIEANHIRLVFNKSTDFFGRIIVYKLDVLSG